MPGTSQTSPTDTPQPLEAFTGPITIVMNAGAGAGDKKDARSKLEEVLRGAGRAFRVVEPSDGESLGQLCKRVGKEVADARGILVAAGGDGTVNTVADSARRHRVPLGVVPLGTFNYFARDRGFAEDVEPAAQALLHGRIATVAAGEVNDRLVLNNASIGLYTELIRRRERAKAKFGRRRIVAALSAAGALLDGQAPFSIQLSAGSAAQPAKTSMLFVSCNAFQLDALGLGIAGCSQEGALGVVLLKPTRLMERLRLLVRAITKDLDEDPALESFCAEGFEVHSRRSVVDVAIDGEILRMQTPLKFQALREAVQVVLPREAK